uniref:Uncharacterized protein n=1 Tax=Anguilla anguilla TaxID=7936 RepID=A0A0E9SC67_ANGAN
MFEGWEYDILYDYKVDWLSLWFCLTETHGEI